MDEPRMIDAESIEYTKFCEAFGNGMYKDVDVVYRTDIDAMPTIDPETLPIVQQLRAELERVTEERETLLKELAGECGLCANYEKCKKYPEYCINGNMWVYHGFKESKHTEKSDSRYRSWFMERFEKEA